MRDNGAVPYGTAPFSKKTLPDQMESVINFPVLPYNVHSKYLGVVIFMGKAYRSDHQKNKKRILANAHITQPKGKSDMEKAVFFEEISNAIAIPQDVLGNLPIVTVTGRQLVHIENYKGIIQYQSDTVRVQTKAGVLCVNGKRLSIDYYSSDEMRISGHILEIRYQM